jgi:hypothetical protein
MTPSPRRTILITHATPEDNAFAMWLASRLVAAGYDAWLDVKALRGGNDFWQVIDAKLRNEAIKQIVCVSKNVTKDGVQKEIAVGNIMRKQLGDSDFIIPVRVDDTPFSQFPIEFVRQNGINAHPNWAECLEPLLETLRDANVPRLNAYETGLLGDLIAAREQGRRAVELRPERLLSNWFPFVALPERLALVTGRGTNDQFTAWLKDHPVPNAPLHRLAAIFTDAQTFFDHRAEGPGLETRDTFDLKRLIEGHDTGSFVDADNSRRYVVNLLRQHWDRFAAARGLLPFSFASGEVGWFFPDGLVTGQAKATLPNGEKVSRVFSGKFKDRRWHLCLLARPRLFPTPVLRVHANLVLSEDGRTPLPGDVTHKLRRRLTRSWWNDKWRDLLLASMAWLAEGNAEINLAVGNESLRLASFPLETEIPASYAAAEAPPTEEKDDGEIVTSEALDAPFDDDLGIDPEEAVA